MYCGRSGRVINEQIKNQYSIWIAKFRSIIILGRDDKEKSFNFLLIEDKYGYDSCTDMDMTKPRAVI